MHHLKNVVIFIHTKENFSSKKIMKNVAWKLVPGSF